jgi:hypothetical protein
MISYIVEIHTYFLDKFNEPETKILCCLPATEDCMFTHRQLYSYLSKRGSGYSNDSHYACYRYQDGNKMERQWVLRVD